MDRAKHVLDRVLGTVLIALMGVSVLNVLWQVFSRFVLNAPSSFTQETARFLLIWIGVLGAGYGVGQRDHLALELVPENLEGKARNWVQIAIQSFILLFAAAILIVGGLRLVYVQLTLGQTSASLEIPIGYVYLVLPLSGAVMVFYALVHMRDPVRALRDDESDRSSEPNPLDPSTDT